MQPMLNWRRVPDNMRWLPAQFWQRLTRARPRARGAHLIIAVADHFEPSFIHQRHAYASKAEQKIRLERWCRDYPRVVGDWRDADGFPWRHTYFYPAEQYDKNLVGGLAEFCHAGWGEAEIHLHHGVERPDTAENTRRVLAGFRDALATRGLLSRWDGRGEPVYGFVHGNWALANSDHGRYCGVDQEIQILAETGCYADFTFPSAPMAAQIAKLNALYECSLPLHRRAAHRRGRNLQRGRAPRVFPLMIQGPLLLTFRRAGNSYFPWPKVENGALSTSNPPTMARFRSWCDASVMVRGRPDWLFIKLYCHGMDPRDVDSLLGDPLRNFLRLLTESASIQGYRLHFVSAREMVNIALAACDGKDGNPADYRDYRLKLITTPRRA